MLKRLLVLVIYWGLAFLTVIFFVYDGHGPAVPLLVYASWPGFLLKLVNDLLKTRLLGYIPGEMLWLGLVLLVIYYLGLMMLTSKLARASFWYPSWVPPAIHFGGGLAFILISDKAAVWPEGVWDSGLLIPSYVVSFGLTALWLSADRFLAKSSQARAKPAPED